MVALLNVLVKRRSVVMMLIAMTLLNSCKDSGNKGALIFEDLNESLERSIVTAHAVTINGKKEIGEDLKYGFSAFKARYWLNKTDTITLLSDELANYIRKMKIDGMKIRDQKFKSKLEDFYNQLKIYRESILKLDSHIENVFNRNYDLIGKRYLQRYKSGKEFGEKIFEQLSTSNVTTKMLQFENDVRIAESDFIVFCKNQFGRMGPAYTKYETIISGNSTKFEPGQELTISAVMGEFKLPEQAFIFINGESLAGNERGIVEYKMNVGNDAGIHVVPIKFKFLNVDGVVDSLEREFEYTVGK